MVSCVGTRVSRWWRHDGVVTTPPVSAADDHAVFFLKAEQSLAGVESECANGRFDNCANRRYDACFQAGVAALLSEGIRANGQWGHDFVRAQFVGQLIHRRKRHPSLPRDTFGRLFLLRQVADDKTDIVTDLPTVRAPRWTRELLADVRTGGRGRP